MKKLITTLFLFTVIFFAQEPQKGSIKLEITGFDSRTGNVLIALFNSNDAYTNTGEALTNISLKVSEDKVTHTFTDLPYGEYAIKLFHDENENNKLDKGLFGIPTEDFAFSNNAKGFMGPASYDDAKFKLTSSLTVQKLTID